MTDLNIIVQYFPDLFCAIEGSRKSLFRRGYALVRPFLYFHHFHIFDLAYCDLFTSTRVLRPFIKSGHLIGREVQIEVQFWSM